ncbi:16S rRNA (uracil(1498)-N(3))-methyltransferase [Thiocapsa imhoffii]|uniref:Ribosomal RNA small subunit methyltransferase E n=1 Tax=Thiocapsa imhoffii TaxID=382777 RepID=A0A9X1B715_9GAMM|nr:16S rRNA (uracil(1498)-N(3))-methyltransferase [Thiocapsa imhoffii]MBK1643339.1 16S rRNA (uracil(1498)-N(3))-methyltransferase [Thiocapsa imhoffii]
MRQPRIYVEDSLAPGGVLQLAPEPARHLTQVLRLQQDAPLVLFNGDGHDYRAQIIHIERSAVRVRILAAGEPEPRHPLAITLSLGVSKGERMDVALQKAVELGVARISPLFTERSQVRLSGARLERRQNHWRGVLIAACEQSGRRRVPRLDPAAPFRDWLDGQGEGGWLLDPTARQPLASAAPPDARITLLVGPEGGLGPREREQARAAGFTGVHLGPRILRTETAPLAAIAIIQALWGDLRGN